MEITNSTLTSVREALTERKNERHRLMTAKPVLLVTPVTKDLRATRFTCARTVPTALLALQFLAEQVFIHSAPNQRHNPTASLALLASTAPTALILGKFVRIALCVLWQRRQYLVLLELSAHKQAKSILTNAPAVPQAATVLKEATNPY